MRGAMLRGMRKHGPRRVIFFGPFSRYKAVESISLNKWSVYDAEFCDGTGDPAFLGTLLPSELGSLVIESSEGVDACDMRYPSAAECMWIACNGMFC